MPSGATGQLPRVLHCIGEWGTQQSNRDKESQRRWRTGGIVSGGHEVDTPANQRWCRNKRHGEKEEVIDAMAMMEKDAAGVGTVAAGWEDKDDKTGKRTTWDDKIWGHLNNGQWRDKRWR